MTADRVLHDLVAQLRVALPARVRFPDDLAFLLELLDHAEAEVGWAERPGWERP